jgi:hypothetical protein
MPPVVGLLAIACASTTPGEVTVSVQGTVSSLVTTVPETTTSTASEQATTTSLPGADPGLCTPPGEILIVPLVEDVQEQNPCGISTAGMIRFSNLTDTDVTVQWGARELEIAPQRSVVPPELVGEVLSPGLHAFETSLESTPTVYVYAPGEGFGAAQVSLRSFGGIRPGQRITDAEADIGAGIVVHERGATCTLGWVAGDPHSPLLALDATEENPLILRAQATTPGQRTLSDVGIGSTAEDLRTAYGDQLTERTLGDQIQLTFEPNEAVDANFRLVFDAETAEDGQSRVVAMRIGRVGEVERSTPCAGDD